MVAEVTGFLAGRGTVLDLTLGAGGHAEALLDAGVERVVGIARDPAAIAMASERLGRFGARFTAVRARFSDMPVENRVDGILFDLGVSSMQLDRPERGLGYRRGGPHPARRTFQALRIAVNRELEELTASLPRAAGVLAPGGRIVVISYHSLEDRITKRFLQAESTLEVLTKKPLTPSKSESARNPRARSAKLRAAEKLPAEEAA